MDSGHVFVVHGDVCRLCADAVLMPTRNLNNRQWFPHGPPPGAIAIDRNKFTCVHRVHPVRLSGPQRDGPQVWLGHLDGRFAMTEERNNGLGRPSLDWFLQAAEQFLFAAYADVAEQARPPRNGRRKHVLAMPVVGTGQGGARGASGEMIQALLQLLHAFTAEHDIDVALVVKSGRMFSAAQAHRRQMAGLDKRWRQSLGGSTRLLDEASRLAALAERGQLGLFLGAGASAGAGLPSWQELLTSLAAHEDVPLSTVEAAQLRDLTMPDQAEVIATRLAQAAGYERRRGAAGAHSGASGSDGGRSGGASGNDGGRSGGEGASGEARLLQELVVSQLGAEARAEYSITHGLLAGLRVSSVVTTNYDALFEDAWRGAQVRFNVLPYEAADADHFILKLHGDVGRPADIVLTRSQMAETREQNAALSGIVQTMLVTQHLLFVGFSLQDPLFTELAGTVRTALQASRRVAADGGAGFGTLLSLHNRPFLSELWPDIRCTPMDLADGVDRPRRRSSAECARRLELLLDRVSLDASTCTQHLLDPDFNGVFSEGEQAVKGHLVAFHDALRRNPAARRAGGYAVVVDTLQQLGASDLTLDEERERLAEPP